MFLFQLGIEILGFIEQYRINEVVSLEKATRERLMNIQQRSMHGPFIDLFAASKDPAIVQVVKKRFSEAYKTAKTKQSVLLLEQYGFIRRRND